LQHGIKINGEYLPCWYWANEKSATISLKRCNHHFPDSFREHFEVVNNTETITDYFENDRINAYPGEKLYDEIKQMNEMVEAKFKAKMAKKYGKNSEEYRINV